jgi:hexosaminidase
MATMHPEILCDYTRTNSASYGYDTRSAFCASREENYELLADILGEVCELFPAEHIHIGGDEVDMSQWKRCPRCQALMRDNNMTNTAELQQYFMSRLTDILAQHGKKPAVWNEAIDGGKLSTDTRVYGWESIKECRTAAANYSTIVMPGQFFYFDMKQSAREPGHDWAAIFDWTKVYNFTLASQGFTEGEQANVLGFEGSFFSEAYASRNHKTPDYLHYQTFPRIVALAEVAWVDSDERDEAAFYAKMVEHYNRLDAMGVAYRLMPPKVVYEDGALSASTDDGSRVFYRREPMDVEMLYTTPIITDKPAEYCFVSRRGEACSPEAGVASHFKTITPTFNITSSMNDSEKFSFDKAEGYGRIARTTRAGDVGDWVMLTFEQPVSCRRMKVATGNFQLPRYTFENGYVEVSYDGKTFERVGELDCGMFYIEYPARPIKAVRITCTSRGNGAEWVSIQSPTIWPKL